MKRAMILLSCLALAIVCYGIGFRLGALLMVGAGMFFEGLFWLKLLRPASRGGPAGTAPPPLD